MKKEPFDEEMRKVVNGLGKSIAIKIADTLKGSYVDLVEDNPILTGQLMSNWFINVGDKNDYVEYFRQDEHVSKEEAIKKSSAHIVKLDEYELGSSLRFANDIHYAQKADTNSSRAGFVSRATTNIEQDLIKALTDFFKNYTYTEIPF